MNKIIYLILFFIVGILLYQILKGFNQCVEGVTGQPHYGKCCPIGYKFSPTHKQCIKICDGCRPSSYNKLKFEWEKTGAYTKAGRGELVAYYDCDDNNSSEIYGYDKLNKIFSESELLDQDDYYSDGSTGPSAAEEGGNETWKDIHTNFGLTTDYIAKSTETSIFPFNGISTNLYYTSDEECDSDYASGMSDKPDSCKGYWKLDTDSRFEYIKDNPDTYYPAPFVITQSTSASYVLNNITSITSIISDMEDEAPVAQYYKNFLDVYSSEAEREEEELEQTLNTNRGKFCNSLLPALSMIEPEHSDPIINTYNYNDLCSDSSKNDTWNSLCSIGHIPNSPHFINDSHNLLCEYSSHGDTKLKICPGSPENIFCEE